MNNKISDFKFAQSILKCASSHNRVPFVNLPVVFGGVEGLVDGCISIGNPKNVIETVYKIVETYVNNSAKFLGQPLFNDSQRTQFISEFRKSIQQSMGADSARATCPVSKSQDLILYRLYQEPLVWILMKDLICPVYHKMLKNVAVVSSDTPFVDGARFFAQDEVSPDSYEHIFVNMGIDNGVMKNAYLFVETLKAHCLDPIETVIDIIDSDLYEKFLGAIKIAFVDEARVNEFMCMMFMVLGLEYNVLGTRQKTAHGVVPQIKVGQQQSPLIWWYFGLPEKMLDPTRGSDWTTYRALQPFNDELDARIDALREQRSKRGKVDGIPFNMLLRVKDGEQDPPDITIQGLLSKKRVW